VPGPQFGDLKRQEGSGVIVLATPAVPPAVDCGTASPCGDRRYGGPARALTFGLLPNKWIKRRPFWHQEGMERNAPSPTFFTERSLAAYLSVSDRTIRNWITRGELPSYKLGASRRIDPADVDAFLALRREEAP
jgi:excisionase family DNA binding protein